MGVKRCCRSPQPTAGRHAADRPGCPEQGDLKVATVNHLKRPGPLSQDPGLRLNLQLKLGFPGGPVVKNSACISGDTSFVPIQEDPTCLRANKPMCHNY